MDDKYLARLKNFRSSLEALSEAWLDMLNVRNELTHDYDLGIIKAHCNSIVNEYIDLFREYLKTANKVIGAT